MKLVLGVEDIPYAGKGSTSTGEVAKYLEKNFGVMQIFFDKNTDFIAQSLETGLAGALENMMMGRQPKNPIGSGAGKIETRFREFITNEESGITTKQALMQSGTVGSRFKRQYRKARGKKITFVDTGNYRRMFKVWVK